MCSYQRSCKMLVRRNDANTIDVRRVRKSCWLQNSHRNVSTHKLKPKM